MPVFLTYSLNPLKSVPSREILIVTDDSLDGIIAPAHGSLVSCVHMHIVEPHATGPAFNR